MARRETVDTVDTAVLIALANIADLPRGCRTVIHNKSDKALHVLRTDRSWVLRLSPNSDHARWCDNKAHLLEDLQHFFLTDYLPRQKQQWF